MREESVWTGYDGFDVGGVGGVGNHGHYHVGLRYCLGDIASGAATCLDELLDAFGAAVVSGDAVSGSYQVDGDR